MALEIKVPDLGEGLTEAEIVQWLVAVGETVAANQPMVEVETAKAVVEISAPRSGTLAHQGAETGATLEVGQLLAVITAEGETWAGGEDGAVDDGAVSPASTPAGAAEGAAPAATSSGVKPSGAVRAVPLVRKLAKDLGIDLATVAGSGPGGQITRTDVEAAATRTGGEVPADTGSSAQPDSAATTEGRPSPPPTAMTGDEAEELSATRRAIAANLGRSWAEIPHVTVWGPAVATALLAAAKQGGGPLEAYLARAVLPVLAEFPEFNANFDGTTLTRRASVNLGLAVATNAGLIVPVVAGVESLAPTELGGRIDSMIAKATTRRLSPDDMAGATFTISNVGAVGGGYGTPIIPHGTTAILSVGRAGDDVVVRNGGIHVAKVFPIALSFDHRVIDGATASQFLNRVVAEVESFAD